MNANDPIVMVIGDVDPGVSEFLQLELACRFYGFVVRQTSLKREGCAFSLLANANGPTPLLAVLHAAELAQAAPAQRSALLAAAESCRAPIAVVGIAPDSSFDGLSSLAPGVDICENLATPASALWVATQDSSNPGFELRGLPFGLSSGAARSQFNFQPADSIQVLATMGSNAAVGTPAMMRIARDSQPCYLLARVSDPASNPPWQLKRATFGEIIPSLLLLRDVGGDRCWHPADAVANLTIDDPWLTEPYGCLSFSGLLKQMQRERFHTTIGFVPWNFDRNTSDVVALFKNNPEHYSIAIHGNNHDRYEFFRFENRPGDQQRAKPLELHAFNIRQGLARMEAFHRCTGLDFDRVMVFPHGVCPARTFDVLKRHGFWATSNYSNVPLDEKPPADPAMALRGVNSQWAGFPAMRRNYPHNYSDEAIAIDLFLGNPVLFMAHQDLFFEGIDAFNAHARRVNERQPRVKWMSLGEISRRLHLLRWLADDECEVRLFSRHAKIDNPRARSVNFSFYRDEPDPELIDQVSIDGTVIPFAIENGRVSFATKLSAHASSLVEVHYRSLDETTTIAIARRGFRYRSLRAIADFRDITVSRSRLGRLLTRKYYVQGKRRPTLSGIITKLTTYLRMGG